MLFTKKDASERLFLCPWMGARPHKTWAQRANKALQTSLFCIAAMSAADPIWAEPACAAAKYDETTRIKYIHDGDTLRLKGGRKVRLIGINAPEATRDNHAAEAFSAEATKSLKALFKNSKSISLIYGEDKYDRYDRLLAHAFTDEGENVQAVLLAQGYARAISFPPNTRFSTCYLQQEHTARCQKTGLWEKAKALTAKKLDDTHIGFQLVTGKLKSINSNKKGIWLNLDDKLTIGIRPDNQSLFDINAIHTMLNHKVVVRGWLNKSKKDAPYYIRIRHPSSLQLASTFTCD